MPSHVAFLRAINVGGHVVKMDRLRALFEEMGFGAVETFIASGNVAFAAGGTDGAALEGTIETRLRDSLGYEVATFVRTRAALAAVSARRPFGDADGATDGPPPSLFIAFLKAPPPPDVWERVLAFRGPTDDFATHGRELYWSLRGSVLDSKFSGARLEKLLGAPATLRNATTVRKLAAKFPAR